MKKQKRPKKYQQRRANKYAGYLLNGDVPTGPYMFNSKSAGSHALRVMVAATHPCYDGILLLCEGETIDSGKFNGIRWLSTQTAENPTTEKPRK